MSITLVRQLMCFFVDDMLVIFVDHITSTSVVWVEGACLHSHWCRVKRYFS